MRTVAFNLFRDSVKVLALSVWLGSVGTAPADADEPLPRVPPLAPAETLRSFHLPPGFQLKPLAAEPLVTDPVAMVYDEQGRAFVAEMRDYPFVDPAHDKPFAENTLDEPIGQIRLLDDSNGDGQFDKSTVFADRLSWPTGLALWKGGLYVVATPDLWYLKDTDGDGRADQRRKVFSGFRKFNIQAVVNNLKWGLDNRLYGAGSSNGGKIVPESSKNRAATVMGTGDFCFDPTREASSFELLTGGARFGNDFDDWGNRFISNIRNPIQHPVLPRRYLARNPHLPAITALNDVAVSGDVVPVYRTSPPEPWRVINAQRLASDLSGAPPRSEAAATGYMTSACGLTVYRGDVYPESFYGTVFLGEVAGNLIHRQALTADSVTFSSRRTEVNREFLTSDDNWFRPVNFVNAPDGTLHVLDMYRETIEHPWSIPDDIKAKLDLRSGSDRGRIYRLEPDGFTPRHHRPSLEKATAAELAALLTSSSSWWRETAQRLIVERQDTATIEPLRSLLRNLQPKFESGRDTAALARLHALWSLEGLGNLSDDDLLFALHDPVDGVREQAVLLAERRLATSQAIRDALLGMCDDSSLRVRFQLALSLGELTRVAADTVRAPVARALASIANRDSSDKWMRVAVLSSAFDVAPALSERLTSNRDFGKLAAQRVWLHDLSLIVGAKSDSAGIDSILASIEQWMKNHQDDAAVSSDGLNQFALGLAEGMTRAKRNVLDILNLHPSLGAKLLLGAIRDAAGRAVDPGENLEGRQSAISLLAHGEFAIARKAGEQLLAPHQASVVQTSAVRMLSTFRPPEVPAILLNAFRRLAPAARGEALEALLARREWHESLLNAIDAGQIRVGEIPYQRRNLLLRSSSATVRERAVALMQSALQSRQSVIEKYQAALATQRGNPLGGAAIFKRECQTCHRLEQEGQDIGPNLTTIRNRTASEILLHILDPNREVAPNYVGYTVLLADGRVLSGVIVEEGANSLSIRTATGSLETIPRGEIDKIASTGQSFMPVGLEERIAPAEMSDLLAYLLSRS